MLACDRSFLSYSRERNRVDTKKNTELNNNHTNQLNKSNPNQIPNPNHLNNINPNPPKDTETILDCKVIRIEPEILDKAKIYNLEIKTNLRLIVGECFYDDIHRLRNELSNEFSKLTQPVVVPINSNERDIQVLDFFDQLKNLPQALNHKHFLTFVQTIIPNKSTSPDISPNPINTPIYHLSSSLDLNPSTMDNPISIHSVIPPTKPNNIPQKENTSVSKNKKINTPTIDNPQKHLKYPQPSIPLLQPNISSKEEKSSPNKTPLSHRKGKNKEEIMTSQVPRFSIQLKLVIQPRPGYYIQQFVIFVGLFFYHVLLVLVSSIYLFYFQLQVKIFQIQTNNVKRVEPENTVVSKGKIDNFK